MLLPSRRTLKSLERRNHAEQQTEYCVTFIELE